MGRGPEQTFLQTRYTNGPQAHDKMLSIINHQGKANHNHSEIPLHTNQDNYNQKKRNITSVDKDVEKLDTGCIAGRDIKWCSCYGKQCGGSSKS